MPSDPRSFIDLEGFEDPTGMTAKHLHAGDEFTGQAYVHLEEAALGLIADRKNLVSVDPDYGVLLAGNVSISAMPDHVSFAGGYFRLNPLVLSTVPSTTPTPIPMLVKSTPKLLEGVTAQPGILAQLQQAVGVMTPVAGSKPPPSPTLPGISEIQNFLNSSGAPGSPIPVIPSTPVITQPVIVSPAVTRLASSIYFANAEEPLGNINDINRIFFLKHAPNPPSSLRLFHSGISLRGNGNDYTLSGLTLTMTIPPWTFSFLEADYRY